MEINRKYKLWEATGKDDWRPAFEYIVFKDGHAYATNAHILVKVPLESIFELEAGESENDINMLNGYCIKAKVYKRLCSYGRVMVEEKNGRVSLTIYYEEQPIHIPLKKSEDIRFPNFDAVLEYKGVREPVDAIGFSAKLLSRLTNALGVNEKIKMSFTKKNSVIFVEPIEEFYRNTMRGVIMPYLVD